MDQPGSIGEVTVVKDEFALFLMRILIAVINSVGVERGLTMFDTMYFVPFLQ